VVRHLYLAAGLICVALGAVGAFLPVLPTVPFLLLAVFCFARSRPEWAERLYAHPRYGPPLREWRDRRAIGRKAKITAVFGKAVAVILVLLTPLPLAARLITVAVIALAAVYVVTRPERRPAEPAGATAPEAGPAD